MVNFFFVIIEVFRYLLRLRRYISENLSKSAFSKERDISANISGGRGQFPVTLVGVERLEISLFRMVLRYWQTIILFCHNTDTDRQTDRPNCNSNTVRCIIYSRTVKKESGNESVQPAAGKQTCSKTAFQCLAVIERCWNRKVVSLARRQLWEILSRSLTLSPPIPLRLYTLSYWSNPPKPFLIFDIRALWHPGLSAREPECQKLKMVLVG